MWSANLQLPLDRNSISTRQLGVAEVVLTSDAQAIPLVPHLWLQDASEAVGQDTPQWRDEVGAFLQAHSGLWAGYDGAEEAGRQTDWVHVRWARPDRQTRFHRFVWSVVPPHYWVMTSWDPPVQHALQ